jgi:UDP-glucose 4-epimerase
MVVHRFVGQALAGEPITVYGDGQQRRSFTWVGDVVEAMADLSGRGEAYGEVFNVGHTEDIAIGELARLILEMTGSRSPIVRVPYEDAYEKDFEDMRRRMPDISKLHALIGYRPRIDLREMLARIIAHQRAC